MVIKKSVKLISIDGDLLEKVELKGKMLGITKFSELISYVLTKFINER